MANLIQIGKVRLVLRSEEFTFKLTAYIWAFACLGVAEPQREGRR
jgi:hypothetical protein